MDMADIHCYDNIGSYFLFRSSPEKETINLPFFFYIPMVSVTLDYLLDKQSKNQLNVCRVS